MAFIGTGSLDGEDAALSFELAPLDQHGVALFSAVHDVLLARHGTGTSLSMTIRVTDARPDAAPALAGMELGWNQLLEARRTACQRLAEGPSLSSRAVKAQASPRGA